MGGRECGMEESGKASICICFGWGLTMGERGDCGEGERGRGGRLRRMY